MRAETLGSLFEALDPAPRSERDLDAQTEAFLVAWAEDLPRDVPLCLTIHLRQGPLDPAEAGAVAQAVRRHFDSLATQQRRAFRSLMRQGRLSLLIGLAFLSGCVLAGNTFAAMMSGVGAAAVLRETLLIGGWIAMWQPLQIYLYDWWPLKRREKLLRRMSAMDVELEPAAPSA